MSLNKASFLLRAIDGGVRDVALKVKEVEIKSMTKVRLIPCNIDFLDESILWAESRGLCDGHRAIRMINNIHLNVDAYHGDKNFGGVHHGSNIVFWDWNKGDNQWWKLLPY